MRRHPFFLLPVAALSLGFAPAPLPRPKTLVDRLIAVSMEKGSLCLDGVAEGEHLTPGDVPRCLRYVTRHPDYRSCHLLLALRRDRPEDYRRVPARVRAAVLCSMLKEVAYSDDLPEACNEIPSECKNDFEQALVGVGRTAIPYLLPLLDDRSEFFLSEVEEEPEYDDYRRADYAFRYASWILGLPYHFEPNPDDRDKAIEALKKKLRTGRKPKQ